MDCRQVQVMAPLTSCPNGTNNVNGVCIPSSYRLQNVEHPLLHQHKINIDHDALRLDSQHLLQPHADVNHLIEHHTQRLPDLSHDHLVGKLNRLNNITNLDHLTHGHGLQHNTLLGDIPRILDQTRYVRL